MKILLRFITELKITKKMEKEGKRVSFLRHVKRCLICKAWKDVSNIVNYGW